MHIIKLNMRPYPLFPTLVLSPKANSLFCWVYIHACLNILGFFASVPFKGCSVTHREIQKNVNYYLWRETITF